MKFARIEPEGGGRPYYAARLSVDGMPLPVNNRYGSWQTAVPRPGGGETRNDLKPEVAADLAKRVRTDRRRRGEGVVGR